MHGNRTYAFPKSWSIGLHMVLSAAKKEVFGVFHTKSDLIINKK